ncbi:MAG: hypothetical protein ABIQ16_04245 [Polyangiaceae bacterium]
MDEPKYVLKAEDEKCDPRRETLEVIERRGAFQSAQKSVRSESELALVNRSLDIQHRADIRPFREQLRGSLFHFEFQTRCCLILSEQNGSRRHLHKASLRLTREEMRGSPHRDPRLCLAMSSELTAGFDYE